MKSWNQNKAKVILLAAGMLFLFVNLSACGTRMDSRQSGFWGSKQDRSIISDEDIRKFVAGVRPYLRSPQAHFRQGVQYQSRHQHELAVEEFNNVLRLDPEHIKALNARGVSSDVLGDYVTAVRSYQAALKLDPELDFVYNNLGYSYFLQGNYTAAVQAFERAVELNDEYVVYQNNLGMAYAEKGEFKKALALFEEEVGGRESDVRGRKSEVGSRESEVGSSKPEVQDQKLAGTEKIETVKQALNEEDKTLEVGATILQVVDQSLDVESSKPEVQDQKLAGTEKAEAVKQALNEEDKTLEVEDNTLDVGHKPVSEVSPRQWVSNLELDTGPESPQVSERFLRQETAVSEYTIPAGEQVAEAKPDSRTEKTLAHAEPVPESDTGINTADRELDAQVEEDLPKPLEEKEQAGSNFYAIQVGAFGPLSNAAEFYLKLVEKGYNAYINEPRSDRLYRVRIGLYNSREDAEKAARSLERVENLDNFVTVERNASRNMFPGSFSASGIASHTVGGDAMDVLREVPLEILNGNGVNGMARRTSDYLAEHDYLIQRIANARHFNFPRTTIMYRPEHEQAAELLAGGLPEKSRLLQVDPLGLQHSGIRLILGKDMGVHDDRLHAVLAGFRKSEEVAAYQAR